MSRLMPFRIFFPSMPACKFRIDNMCSYLFIELIKGPWTIDHGP
jgi:hypothetical protein